MLCMAYAALKYILVIEYYDFLIETSIFNYESAFIAT